MPLPFSRLCLAFGLVLAAGCSRYGAVYPPRPPATPGNPDGDPEPSRVVTHVTVTADALRSALDEALPREGDGTFRALGGDRRYTWSREPAELAFDRGRIVATVHATATVELPAMALRFPLDVVVHAEPVLNADYAVKLQSTEVAVTSKDTRLRVANWAGGIYDLLATELDQKLRTFSYDLKPLLGEQVARLQSPVELPVGDAKGCAKFRVLGFEAGPTVLADGVEKDMALILAPQVTFPCAPGPVDTSLPPFANVATLTPGPFTVTVPIVARYDELKKAMGLVFDKGRYYFSKEYPDLYLSEPELYASQEKLVLKLRIQGKVDKGPVTANLDGDLFLSGHPAVIDNELTIPDLEPTIESRNLLLSLKAMTDADTIRDQARQAMRLDIGERLKVVRDKLASDLTFGSTKSCFHGDLDKIEVKGVYPHASYLRVYVAITGRTSLRMPCANPVATRE